MPLSSLPAGDGPETKPLLPAALVLLTVAVALDVAAAGADVSLARASPCLLDSDDTSSVVAESSWKILSRCWWSRSWAWRKGHNSKHFSDACVPHVQRALVSEWGEGRVTGNHNKSGEQISCY